MGVFLSISVLIPVELYSFIYSFGDEGFISARLPSLPSTAYRTEHNNTTISFKPLLPSTAHTVEYACLRFRREANPSYLYTRGGLLFCLLPWLPVY
jgi:hypothetical protein